MPSSTRCNEAIRMLKHANSLLYSMLGSSVSPNLYDRVVVLAFYGSLFMLFFSLSGIHLEHTHSRDSPNSVVVIGTDPTLSSSSDTDPDQPLQIASSEFHLKDDTDEGPPSIDQLTFPASILDPFELDAFFMGSKHFFDEDGKPFALKVRMEEEWL